MVAVGYRQTDHFGQVLHMARRTPHISARDLHHGADPDPVWLERWILGRDTCVDETNLDVMNVDNSFGYVVSPFVHGRVWTPATSSIRLCVHERHEARVQSLKIASSSSHFVLHLVKITYRPSQGQQCVPS